MTTVATPTKQPGFAVRHVPALGWIGDYQWGKWLRRDLIAGVSVAALLIPESMGYAGVAGLPPQVGLYAAPLALIAYAVLGRSTVLVVAASSSTAAISASVISELNDGGQGDAAIALSASLALFTGIVFVCAGLLRLGWVANFMSTTVIEGFIIGLSISIIIGQLDDLVGIDVAGDNSFEELGDVLTQIGDWDRPTVVVGTLSLVLLFGLERFVKKLPAALTVVTLGVLYIKLADPSTVAVVGDIPQGLPGIGMPDFTSSQIEGLIAGGLAVALIGFSEGFGAASSFARKYKDRLQNDQEFIAFGASNIGAALSSGMVVGGSLSKTAANDSAKAKSQMSSITNAVLVVLTLLFLAPFFEKLPEATLAAVVIHALAHSANPRKLAPVWKVSRQEFLLAVGVLIAVLALDTLPAIILGVVVSLGILTYRVSFPRQSELGRDPATGTFESMEYHAEADPIAGIVLYRFEAPLVYANARALTDDARDLVDSTDPTPRVFVLDCEMMFGIDYTGTEALKDLYADLREAGVELRLARVHQNVRERLGSSGLMETLGEGNVFPQLEGAIETRS